MCALCLRYLPREKYSKAAKTVKKDVRMQRKKVIEKLQEQRSWSFGCGTRI